MTLITARAKYLPVDLDRDLHRGLDGLTPGLRTPHSPNPR
jgi:hypothetical protein